MTVQQAGMLDWFRRAPETETGPVGPTLHWSGPVARVNAEFIQALKAKFHSLVKVVERGIIAFQDFLFSPRGDNFQVDFDLGQSLTLMRLAREIGATVTRNRRLGDNSMVNKNQRNIQAAANDRAVSRLASRWLQEHQAGFIKDDDQEAQQLQKMLAWIDRVVALADDAKKEIQQRGSPHMQVSAFIGTVARLRDQDWHDYFYR